MTRPLIAALEPTSSAMAARSCTALAVSVFIDRPGTSKVASAMPSASTSNLKVSRFMSVTFRRLPAAQFELVQFDLVGRQKEKNAAQHQRSRRRIAERHAKVVERRVQREGQRNTSQQRD